jgi:preprotein translocase subunit SecY
MPLATVFMIFNVEVLGLCTGFGVLTRPLLLQAAPAAVEAITKLTAFRGFAGTSVLIIVGVATDTARKV